MATIKKLKIEDVQEILNRLSEVGRFRERFFNARVFGKHTYSDNDGFEFCIEEPKPSVWGLSLKFKDYNFSFAWEGETFDESFANCSKAFFKALVENIEANDGDVKALWDKYNLKRSAKSIAEHNQSITKLYTIEEVTEMEATMEAIRFNQDKTRYDLIPPEFIREVAEVFTFGANKYTPDNWKGFTPEQQEEIKGSLLRHIYAYLEGEENDPESGLSHLAHAGCNLAFMLYFKNRREG